MSKLRHTEVKNLPKITQPVSGRDGIQTHTSGPESLHSHILSLRSPTRDEPQPLSCEVETNITTSTAEQCVGECDGASK